MIVSGGQVTVGGEVVGEFSKMFEWRGSKVHYEGLLLLVDREVIEKVLEVTDKPLMTGFCADGAVICY